MNYFWINAKSDEWCFHMKNVGETEEFLQYNLATGKKKQWARCFENASIGDIFVGYQGKPASAIVAIGKVTKPLYPNKHGDMVIDVTKYVDLENYVSKEDLQNIGLVDFFPVSNGKGTIFDMNQIEVEKVFDAIEMKNPDLLKEENDNKKLFNILKELSIEDAISYAKKNGTYLLGRKYEKNRSYNKSELSDIFGISKIEFTSRSNIDYSLCMFSGIKDDYASWDDDKTFAFSARNVFDRDFDINKYESDDENRSLLMYLGLEKYIHVFYKVDDEFEYLGVAELYAEDFKEEENFDYSSNGLDESCDKVGWIQVEGKLIDL